MAWLPSSWIAPLPERPVAASLKVIIDKERYMISKLCGFALAAFLVPGLAAASDGPFANVTALKNYWNSAGGSGHTEIFVNGREVLDIPGSNPSFVKQYFTCLLTSDIRVHCNSGYDGAEFLPDLLATLDPQAEVYLNGVLYRNGSGPTPYDRAEIEHCSGDSSYYGVETYYLVTAYYDGFGVPWGNYCY
jgi:hypothetical protein